MTQEKYRTFTSALTRIATGGAVVVLLAAALVLPAQQQAPAPQFFDLEDVSLGAGITSLVCPGAPELSDAQSAEEVVYDPELGTGEAMRGRARVVGAGVTDIDAHWGIIGSEPVTVGSVIDEEIGPLAAVAQYPPVGGNAPAAAGITLSYAEKGDLRGLAAAGCVEPTSSTWLVGGNTDVGSSTQLVLANPGETAVRVKVQAWTALGRGAETTLLVEPGQSASLLTETLERTDRIAFWVTAEGGKVAAFLNTHTLEGIVPMGVSQVMASAPPAVDTFVGPVHLEDFAAGEWQTDVRVLNPGEEAATFSIMLLGPEGEQPLAGAEELIIEAGVVSDIPVAGPSAGEYTLRIVSSHPIVAAMRTRALGQWDEDLRAVPMDQFWLASGHPLEEAILINEPRAVLAATNPLADPTAVEVEMIGEDGQARWVENLVIAGTSTVVIGAAEDVVAVRLVGGVSIASAQYQQGGPLIAAVPAAGTATGSVTIAVVADN